MTTTEDVPAVIKRIQNGQQDIARTVDDLNDSTEQRIVTALALARLVRDDPGHITEEPEPLIETLAENALARPIADSLLGSTYNLTNDGIDDETIVRGSVHALEEAHNRLDDLVRSDSQVPGGGSSEVALAMELRENADNVAGRKQLLVEAIADALESVASTKARQAGINPVDAVVDIRSSYLRREFMGINTETGQLDDASNKSMLEAQSAVRARITDGVVLGMIVFRTYGTIGPLETLTGYDPSLGV